MSYLETDLNDRDLEAQLPQVILHLGAHKTGTTSVQRSLRNSSDALEREGWVFQGKRIGPLTDSLSDLHRPAGAGRPDDDAIMAHIRASAHAVIAAGRRLVISDETLIGQPGLRDSFYPDSLRRLEILAGALSGLAVRPLLVVRRQPDFVESWYVQTVKQGAGWAFDDFLAGVDPDRLSWWDLSQRIANAFATTPQLVAYEWLIRQEYGLTGWFRQQLGLPARSETGVPDLNSGYGDGALMVALAAHPYLDADGRAKLRRFLERNVPPRADDPPQLLTLDGRRRLVAAQAVSNEQCFAAGAVADSDVIASYLGHQPSAEAESPLHDECWSARRAALETWSEVASWSHRPGDD